MEFKEGQVLRLRFKDPTSDSSVSDGDRRTSKARRKEDKKKKKKRKEDARRKDKRKHRKKRPHSSSNSESSGDDEKRSKKRKLLKEAKRILKSHKKQKNDVGGGVAATEQSFTSRKALTEEDYYEKNNEFSEWLKEEHELYFSNLSADDTRRLFLDFVQAWNSGKLSKKLYSGIHSAARTDHKWQFKGVKESSIDREEELEFMKKLEKSQRRKFRNEEKDLIDELLPKATGRERLLEKKSIRRVEARLREESPELLKEQDIMGGSEDFKQRLGKERAWREKKALEKNEALKEKKLAFDQKEVAAMDQFKTLVNVAGGKITIPKRVQ